MYAACKKKLVRVGLPQFARLDPDIRAKQACPRSPRPLTAWRTSLRGTSILLLLPRDWHQITQLPENTMATYQWTASDERTDRHFQSRVGLAGFRLLERQCCPACRSDTEQHSFHCGWEKRYGQRLGHDSDCHPRPLFQHVPECSDFGSKPDHSRDDSTANGDDGANAITLSGFAEGQLIGLGGNDTLSGSYGNDLLDGGAGDDVLDGGDAVLGASIRSATCRLPAGSRSASALAGPQNTFGAG